MKRLRLSDLSRIVVAVDPAATSNEESDETGIIVVGKDDNGHGYVLDDLSGRYPPLDWACRAIGAYHKYKADRIVAEVNNGGDMVENTIRMVDKNVPFTAVRASRGKIVRAEPIAALYEQGRIHHVGMFPILEDQMCSFSHDFDRVSSGYSPDRVDALVWGISELLVQGESFEGLLTWYREEAARINGTGPGPARPQPLSNDAALSNDADDVALPRAAVGQILFTTPSAMFQVSSGRRYQANEQGEIECGDDEDRTDLLRCGCSAAPLV